MSVALLFSSSSSELYRRLDQKGGRVLYVAAHPDDENTRLLAWLVHSEGAEAAYLSLTRGEGGQNLIGKEQGPGLGAIREQELLAARTIDGAQQYFAGLEDFGYSKSPEEALAIWGHDRALAAVVKVFREFKPDVIITRFNPTPMETHGHHTASAQLALEAFSKAADPSFPGGAPWQAKRIVWNGWQLTEGFSVDVGGFDPILGMSYTEIAARSRTMHKSQGFGATPTRGEVKELFKLLAGAPMTASLLDGVSRTQKTRVFDFKNPAASVAALLSENASPALIADVAGLFVEATVADSYAVAGSDGTVKLTVINRSGLPLKLEQPQQTALPQNKAWTAEHKVSWPATVDFVLSLDGKRFTLTKPILRAWNDPVHGERRAPVAIVPAVTVTPDTKVLVFADGLPKWVNVRVRAMTGSAKGTLALGEATKPFELKAGGETTLAFQVAPKDGVLALSIDGAPAQSATLIDYPHIPQQTLLAPAELKLVKVAMKKGGKRIGYVMGAGDLVPEALTQVGYDVTLLDLDLVEKSPLDRFDAIVLGIRAYNTHARLAQLQPRLLAYVSQGGVVVAQYNTMTKDAIGPYPFELSHDRVTEENAVATLIPHPLWNAPNKIVAADFDGWVQERGLYFAKSWDKQWEPLISWRDKGEPERNGGLLVAKHGKGRFVYTGISFFRQLPAGVPGAFRLFANLIAK